MPGQHLPTHLHCGPPPSCGDQLSGHQLCGLGGLQRPRCSLQCRNLNSRAVRGWAGGGPACVSPVCVSYLHPVSGEICPGRNILVCHSSSLKRGSERILVQD